jgi:conjugative relaxase-like TrwC/TraI family protein
MLRIIQNSHGAGAKSYYSTSAEYYSEGQELAGQFRGKGAKLLGLGREVDQASWDALCDNLNPTTGEKLTPRVKDNRTVGYDFNFHVPKSVSLLYGVTRDERILDAFREAMRETMEDIESEVQTRVRKTGQNEDRTTGNLVWGEFVHFTSRPVDGVPDPHLHGHCFVFNVTHDNDENRWKAAQFRNLKRDAPYFQAAYHNRLARNLAAAGLSIERTAKGWEVAGLTPGMLNKFSRRTQQIEAAAKEKGITDPEQKGELGAKTRQKKQKELSTESLRQEWLSRLSDGEGDALVKTYGRLGGVPAREEPSATREAVDHAIEHCFERKSVVPERVLIAEALKHGVGKVTLDGVRQEIDRQGVITATRGGQVMTTTRAVLAEERRMLGFAREGRGTCKPLGKPDHVIQRDWLNADQRSAVRHVLSSRDRVMLIRGAAGVGKTVTMQETVEAIEQNGKQVFAFAPSADASRGVLREKGFASADTVARLLLDERLQQRVAGQVLWIDEAGLLGSRTMASVFDLADRLDCRVILQGDTAQHGSVERGAALRLLEEQAGLKPAAIKEIQRQKGDYKEAVQALSEGRIGEGFDRLDDLQWIKEVPDDQRYQTMAADYVATVDAGKSCLTVSPTHSEGRRITAEIRRLLQEKGKLGTDERDFITLENSQLTTAQRRDASNYRENDVIVFHQNAKGGYRRGQRIAVETGSDLPLDQAERFQLFRQGEARLAAGDLIRITRNGQTADKKHDLHNGALYRVKGFSSAGDIVLANGWTVAKDYGHLAPGYCVTSMASQGKDFNVVLVGQSAESFPASSQEQFYVSASRGQKACRIYCDSKELLREAVSRSEDRLSATELFQPDYARVPLRERQREQDAEWRRTRERNTHRELEAAHER